jgi:hypothetical protein
MRRIPVLALLAVAGCATVGSPTPSQPRVTATATTSPTVSASTAPAEASAETAPTAIDLLECDGARSSIGGVGHEMASEGGGGGATPDDALAAFLASSLFVMPSGPYDPIGSTGDRVAYGFRAGSEVKVVVVVSTRFAADIGAAFVIDELRMCDESEFGSEAVFLDGRRAWTHIDTGAILTDIIGPGHCGWESARIMHVGTPGADWRQYVRDPEGVLRVPLRETYSSDADGLPDDATDSGYRTADGAELWFTDSDRAAYVVLGDTIERWPRAVEIFGCS